MKQHHFSCASWLKLPLVVALLFVSDGCRRRANPVPPPTATAVESSAPQPVQIGGTVVLLAPAPPITNNVAPPPRVDAKSGRPILQGDSTIVKQRTATE